MGRYLAYKIELIGTKESDIIKQLKKLDEDFAGNKGIYAEMCGTIPAVDVNLDSGNIIIVGVIKKDTAKQCKTALSLIKSEAIKAFPTCTAIIDNYIVSGKLRKK